MFLAALYCFYNDADGALMLQKAYGVDYPVGIGTIASRVDDQRRRIIAELFLTYRG